MVKIIKNKEIPSNPRTKLIFDDGIHWIISTNWNFAVELSKYNQKKSEYIKANNDIQNPKIRIVRIFESGIAKSIRLPIIGMKHKKLKLKLE